MHYGGAVRLLVIEVKVHGAPRFVRSAVYQLQSCVARIRQYSANGPEQIVPLLVCPYLSPESRTVCRDHDVAYLDSKATPVSSSTASTSNEAFPPSEARNPSASVGLHAEGRRHPASPAAGTGRPWLVTDLAASANASLGMSATSARPPRREWVDRRHDGIVLTQPDVLIQTWRENYRRPRADRFDAYTHLHGRQFDDLARTALNAQPGSPRAVYALASAAQWIAPFSPDATRSFYADAAGARVLRESLDVRPASTGPNVIVHTIADESIFDDAIEPLPGMFCTSPIITCLDLWCGNDREREAADHLAREALPWIA